MKRTAIAVIVVLLAGIALVSSAQVIEPKGSVQNLADVEMRNAIEGIHSHRFDGNTVRFTRVEADRGALSPDHNHANEQFLFLQSGARRRRMDSGIRSSSYDRTRRFGVARSPWARILSGPNGSFWPSSRRLKSDE